MGKMKMFAKYRQTIFCPKIGKLADPENLSTHSWIRNKLYILKLAFPSMFFQKLDVFFFGPSVSDRKNITSLNYVLKIRVNIIHWWFLLLYLMKKSEIDLCIFQTQKYFVHFLRNILWRWEVVSAEAEAEAGEWPGASRGWQCTATCSNSYFSIFEKLYLCKTKNEFVQNKKYNCAKQK